MGWYSWFSTFYDQSLERLYAPWRERMMAHVEGRPARILDVACGTGQNFPFLLSARAEGGELVGVDLDPGMLGQARRRVEKAGWEGVTLKEADVRHLSREVDQGAGAFDLVVCTLGLTVVPEWESVFEAAWDLVRPGGQAILLDVWVDRRTFQTWMVERMARADLDRQVWGPLEARAEGFVREVYDEAKPGTFGGQLFTAVGRKPT